MQVNRMFEILYLLMNQNMMNAKQLAEHFEVSIRTIYRDVENLSAAGIPIYMTRGKYGGISLLPDYVFHKAMINEEEKQRLLSSLQAFEAVNPDKRTDLNQKLKSFLGADSSDWIQVDFGFWSDGKKEAELFQQLKQAILEKRQVCLQYINKNGETMERMVDPLKLVFRGTAWYLLAFCNLRQEDRYFKLKRIAKCELLESFYQGDMKNQGSQYQKDMAKMYQQNRPHGTNVKILVGKSQAYRVYDDFTQVKVVRRGDYLKGEAENDGYLAAEVFYVEMEDVDPEWLAYHMLSYGKELYVLEPKELREQINQELILASAMYEKYEPVHEVNR